MNMLRKGQMQVVNSSSSVDMYLCSFVGKGLANTLVLLLQACEQLRGPFDRSALADRLQFGAQHGHRACSQIVTAALEVMSHSLELFGLPLDHSLAEGLQQRRRFEFERLGQFLHDT